jgi:putative spermidine/putrescine transport system substrate-binding protein
MELSCFEILGVTPQASQPEIDTAYDKKRAELVQDAEALRRLDEAYATLSHPSRRAAYLRQLATVGLPPHEEAGDQRTKGSERSSAAPTQTSLSSKEAAEVTAPSPLPVAGLTPGQFLGRYRIVEPFGEGGMARVYKAFDTRLERDVAIKVIGLGLPLSGSALERFQREAKDLARLAHPNIVKILDFGEHERLPYLVMEFLPGGTLRDRLGKPIPYDQAAQVLAPIARALQCAHQKRIIHRDVKPSNILFTESGQPMLSDFGVAKVLADSRPDLTTTGIVLGTPEYMAPEQALAEALDGRADVYALGIVLYEMLKGRTPFHADTPMAVLLKQVNEALPPLALSGAKPPESVEAVLRKALAKKPENRFATMGEFADALDRLAQERTVPSPSLTLNKMRKTRRSSLLPFGIFFGLVVVLLGTFAVFRFASRPKPNPCSAATISPGMASGATDPSTSLQSDPPPSQTPPGTLSPKSALAAAAKQEGALNVIALPHSWCDYGDMICQFENKYGLIVNEINPNASSTDELSAIKVNERKPGPQAPDVIDLGSPFGPQARYQWLIAPYKVTTWDTIPAGEKDTNAYWYGGYYGVIAFEVNRNVVKDPPLDWSDLLNPKYRHMVALSGDPRSDNTAVQAVFAAGLSATGGDSATAGAYGLDFFSRLDKAGNLLATIGNEGTVASGETPILLTWDYQSLADSDALGGNPPILTVIPKTGVVADYHVQAISAYAPHHSAAELWMEYLYSDEGQLTWLKGYCHPIRYSDLAQRKVIPGDLAAKLPDPASYTNVFFPDQNTQLASWLTITNDWGTVVGVDVK